MKISIRTIGVFLFYGFLVSSLVAQPSTRSGYIYSPQNDLRKFPCGGIEILEENFSGNDIPIGWTVMDVDGQQPFSAIANPPLAVGPGWQTRNSLLDPRNRLLISPSWYEDSTQQCDDWLISPQITLGDNTCLSWLAYSVDPFFAESYEIRISLASPDIDSTGFLAIPPLLSVEKEDNESVYRSLNLATYAGRDVYLAFRHTSKDKFALALDDIRLADVNMIDLTPFALEVPQRPQIDDEIEIKGAIRNVGSDTLSIDSTVTVSYSIDEDTIETIQLRDSLVIAPNDSVQFTYDSIWIPTRDKVYRICLWINDTNDMNIANDTACYWVGVGRLVGLEDELGSKELQVYPNPVMDQLSLRLSEAEVFNELDISLIDLDGREVLRTRYIPAGNKNVSLSLINLSAGVYILQLKEKGRFIGRVKVVKR